MSEEKIKSLFMDTTPSGQFLIFFILIVVPIGLGIAYKVWSDNH